MKTKDLKELIKLFESTSLTALELDGEEGRVRLERAPLQQHLTVPALPQPVVHAAPQAAPQPVDSRDAEVIDMNNVQLVKSPMVGVFYAAPKPGAEPYVKRGQKVKKGDVLCIIEAMKLMNEIISDYDGEVADVCIDNGQLVEYGQTLYKIY